MKKKERKRKPLPEVHILGGLKEVKTLVKGVNRKKALVVFRNAEKEELFLELDGKFVTVTDKDRVVLEKDYRLIEFLFFPGQKRVEPVEEEKPKKKKAEGKTRKKSGTP